MLWIYIRTLGDKMTPSLQRPAGKGILQHDNNPQETAKITQKRQNMSPDLKQQNSFAH